ncbi:LMBD1 protein, partial [Arenaria interpres]|nr:LMBD1 protein [Arenaria interpres]
GLTALSFSISSLTVIGMLAAITYTAYGMSALPLNLIKGTTSATYERLENTEDIEEVEQHLLRIKSKCRDGRPLSSRDRRTMQQLEERLRTLRRRERHLESIEKSWWTKFCEAIRPLKIVWGVFFIIVALLFTVSLFLSNLDKALHSAGFDSGFIILGTNLTNPLNMLLPVLQTVFPLDYVLITTIVMYFIFTSMAGIRNMGIWFFWIRLYKIRRGKTQPQALLFLCMILLLIVLHTSYMIYSLAPQYVMYGSQKYLVQGAILAMYNLLRNVFRSLLCVNEPIPVAYQCLVTRTYLFLHKFWFFSAAYYFGNWAFIAVFLIGLIVSCCKGKKSVIEGEVDEDDSDMSDDELSVYY